MRTPIRYAVASAAAVIAASAGLAGLAGPAHAAQSMQTLSCGGQELTVRVNVNKSPNGSWSAAQIVAGGPGHLIPTEFTGSLYDETLGQTLFAFNQVKGGGKCSTPPTWSTTAPPASSSSASGTSPPLAGGPHVLRLAVVPAVTLR